MIQKFNEFNGELNGELNETLNSKQEFENFFNEYETIILGNCTNKQSYTTLYDSTALSIHQGHTSISLRASDESINILFTPKHITKIDILYVNEKRTCSITFKDGSVINGQID